MFREKRPDKWLRALGLVFDAIAFGVFLILFFLSSGWEATLSALFALWCAYDWWIGYNTRIID